MRSNYVSGLLGLLAVVVYFGTIIAVAIGWVWNIVKIFGSAADPLTALFVLRCIGIFLAPLGAVVGYL